MAFLTEPKKRVGGGAGGDVAAVAPPRRARSGFGLATTGKKKPLPG